MSEDLKRTKLYDWHVAHGGRMVPFAGWEMPVRYDAGALEEHRIVRRSAGLFDIDHMGQITVAGPDAETFLNRLVTWDIRTISTNQSHYALMCLENGGIVDDVFVYKKADHWFVVVNASNLEKDFQWMTGHADGFDVAVTDVSAQTYMVAFQGPRALTILQTLVGADLGRVNRFAAVETEIAKVPTFIGRTGYTGEDGAELFFPAESALAVWEALLAAGKTTGWEVQPIGLAARDSLRFEPGFPLYGHEIDADTTPLEANLGWTCCLESDFIGRDALVRQKADGVKKKLVGFELKESGVPRQDCVVTNRAGVPVGLVVEGLYAPTADKYCGHAFVGPEYAAVGTPLFVVIREKPKAAVVVKRPFYQPSYR
jgi:glycine cleavage system T protein